MGFARDLFSLKISDRDVREFAERWRLAGDEPNLTKLPTEDLPRFVDERLRDELSISACIWIRIAAALEAGAEPKRCDQCGSVFFIGGGAATSRRGHSKFCDPKCKAKWWRTRKVEAEEKRLV